VAGLFNFEMRGVSLVRRGLQSWRGLIIFGFRMIGRIIGNLAPTLVLVVLLLSGGSLAAQAILAPPFGLQWGDTPDKILDWAREKNLEVNIKIPANHPEIRDIRVSSVRGSLPGHQAYAVETRYHWGKLFEVTVHYGAPGRKVSEIRADFERVKKAMVAKHGQFTPDAKRDKREDGYIRRKVSYHVEPVSGLLLLMVKTEVEDTLRKKRSARFSLLYRNENVIPKK